MKKDRNAFFSEYGFNGMNNGYNPNMMMGANAAGYPSAGAVNMPLPTDIDSRLAKIERGLNRLETRVNRLEGETGTNTYENEYGVNNSMYMV